VPPLFRCGSGGVTGSLSAPMRAAESVPVGSRRRHGPMTRHGAVSSQAAPYQFALARSVVRQAARQPPDRRTGLSRVWHQGRILFWKIGRLGGDTAPFRGPVPSHPSILPISPDAHDLSRAPHVTGPSTCGASADAPAARSPRLPSAWYRNHARARHEPRKPRSRVSQNPNSRPSPHGAPEPRNDLSWPPPNSCACGPGDQIPAGPGD
jgi:hypothetical protein